jgi:HlyD family secretion protein
MGVDLNNLRIDLPEKGRGRISRSSAVWKLTSLVLAALLVLLGINHFSGLGGSRTGQVIDTFPVIYSGGGSASLFTAGGWIEPAFPCPVVVSALVSGRIEKLNVIEGAAVEKDQVIAILYKKDLADALAKAEAELAFATARLGKLQAGYRKEEVEQGRAAAEQSQARLARLEAGYRTEEIEKAKAVLEEALADEAVKKSIRDRSRDLFGKGAISQEELDKEEAFYEQARARAKKAQEALRLFEAGYRKEEVEEARAQAREAQEKLSLLEAGFRKEEIEETQAQVAQATAAAELARAQLSYAEIKAPVAGRILELHVEQGHYVTAQKSAIVSIYNPADMQVRVDVRQENVSKVQLGQSARILTDARKGKPYRGKVIRIDPKANLARDTIRVKVRIEEPDSLLYPEMTATVDFLAEGQGDQKPALIVPSKAVLSENGQDFVFVIRQGVARKTRVTLGKSSGENVTVTSGVREGDEVAVTHVQQLKDGQRVVTSE